MKTMLRALAYARLKRLAKDLGLPQFLHRDSYVRCVAEYCADSRLSKADLLARWPTLETDRE